MRRLYILLAALAAIAPVSVSASTPIEAKEGKPWKHKATGTLLPATLAGFNRTSLVYFTAPEVDVAANYASADGGEAVTLYLYRNVSGGVPVWFDRSRFYIMNLPDKWGTATGSGIRALTPRGQQVASGLMESYSVTKTGRSTGLMIFPYNGFYAKIRATSNARDLPGLEALMMQAVNSLDWSTKWPVAPASQILDCPQPLAPRQAAKQIEGDNDASLLAGLLGAAVAQTSSPKPDKDDANLPPPTFCREPGQASLAFGIYRPNSDARRFMLAVGDGGRAIVAGPNEIGAIIGGEIAEKDGKAAPDVTYTVTFVELDKTKTFADFDSLPTTEQVVDVVEKGRPVSTATTWGKKRDIQIHTN